MVDEIEGDCVDDTEPVTDEEEEGDDEGVFVDIEDKAGVPDVVTDPDEETDVVREGLDDCVDDTVEV